MYIHMCVCVCIYIKCMYILLECISIAFTNVFSFFLSFDKNTTIFPGESPPAVHLVLDGAILGEA